ncbi:MAG: S-layer homology domain-containing protein [Oscillospiraceae bacterium]|nr:S-layer homology domain-containing protein [Oscillospiraceae bacterium]
MKKIKVTLSCVLVLALLIGLIPAALAVSIDSFTDISSYMPAKEHIFRYIIEEKGVISGSTSTLLNPTEVLGRGQVVYVLCKVFGIDLTNVTVNIPFTDVSPSAYYAKAVSWAYNQNPRIVGGTSATLFSPTAAMIRQDFCVLFSRFCANRGITLPNNGSTFVFSDDSSINAYAKDAVYQLHRAGIVNGDGNGAFLPGNNIPKVAMIELLYNYYVPTAARLTAPTLTATATTSTISVGWSGISGAQGYDVKLLKGSTVVTNWTSNGTSTSKTFTGLSAGTAYTVHVRAKKTYNSNTLYSPTKALNCSTIVAVTSISFAKGTISVLVNGTGTNTKTVVPSNATNESIAWTSNKSSVATVNSSGTVSGVSIGMAKITATSVANTNVSKSYWVVVRPSSTRNVSVSFHSEETLRAEYSNDAWKSKFTEWHNAVKPSFLYTFGISLTNGGHYTESGRPDQGCPRGNSNICTTACGTGSCNPNHHKSSARMLGIINSANYPAALNVYMASHVWCYDGNQGTHGQCTGMAYMNGKVSAVDARKSRGDLSITRTVAHEFMHNFNCPDVDNNNSTAAYRCSSERKCVLWDYFDSYTEMNEMILCNNCYNRFSPNAH